MWKNNVKSVNKNKAMEREGGLMKILRESIRSYPHQKFLKNLKQLIKTGFLKLCTYQHP